MGRLGGIEGLSKAYMGLGFRAGNYPREIP